MTRPSVRLLAGVFSGLVVMSIAACSGSGPALTLRGSAACPPGTGEVQTWCDDSPERHCEFRVTTGGVFPCRDVASADCTEAAMDALAACRAGGVGTDGGVPDDAPAPPVDELDLLFMIDNSNSTASEQALLGSEIPRLLRILVSGDRDEDGTPDFTPVRSMHLGVVTSDLGAGPTPPAGPSGIVPSCAPGFGDDGILRTVGNTGRADCAATYPPIFDFSAGTADVTSFAYEVLCVAAVGTGGCGFEQQLEATLKAVSPGSATAAYVPDGYVTRSFAGTPHGDAENAGFVRRDSVLALFLLTDEDDCSVPDYSLLYGVEPYNSAPLNLRCFTFPEALYPTSRYVDGLLALRSEPARLVLGGLVGIPDELAGSDAAAYTRALADSRMAETLDPSESTRLLPACTSADGVAFPARRIVEVARGLDDAGAHTTMQSVCAVDYRPSIDAYITELAAALGAP